MVMVWLEGGQGEVRGAYDPLPPNTSNCPTWTPPPATDPPGAPPPPKPLLDPRPPHCPSLNPPSNAPPPPPRTRGPPANI